MDQAQARRDGGDDNPTSTMREPLPLTPPSPHHSRFLWWVCPEPGCDARERGNADGPYTGDGVCAGTILPHAERALRLARP